MSTLALVSWDPILTGYLAVLLGIVVLCGSTYMLLATNLGARLGFLVAWTGLWSWMFLMGLVWWVFAIGWIGPGPSWQTVNVVSDVRGSLVEPVRDLHGVAVTASLPEEWHEFNDADARSTSDTSVVCSGDDSRLLDPVNTCYFGATTEFEVLRVLETGGEKYRVLGIPENAFTSYFIPSRSRARYAVVQLQAYEASAEIDRNLLDPDTGKAFVPEAKIDQNAPVYSVVMVRDQGSKRLRPALTAIFSGLMFSLGCYHLHRRDQALWAVREAAGSA